MILPLLLITFLFDLLIIMAMTIAALDPLLCFDFAFAAFFAGFNLFLKVMIGACVLVKYPENIP